MAWIINAFVGTDQAPPPVKPKLATPQDAMNPQKLLSDYNILFHEQQQAIYLLKIGKVEILNKLLEKLIIEITKNIEFVRPVKREKLKTFLDELQARLKEAIDPPNKQFNFVPDSDKRRLDNEIRSIRGLEKLIGEDLLATIDEKAYMDRIDYYFRPYRITQLWNAMWAPSKK